MSAADLGARPHRRAEARRARRRAVDADDEGRRRDGRGSPRRCTGPPRNTRSWIPRAASSQPRTPRNASVGGSIADGSNVTARPSLRPTESGTTGGNVNRFQLVGPTLYSKSRRSRRRFRRYWPAICSSPQPSGRSATRADLVEDDRAVGDGRADDPATVAAQLVDQDLEVRAEQEPGAGARGRRPEGGGDGTGRGVGGEQLGRIDLGHRDGLSAAGRSVAKRSRSWNRVAARRRETTWRILRVDTRRERVVGPQRRPQLGAVEREQLDTVDGDALGRGAVRRDEGRPADDVAGLDGQDLDHPPLGHVHRQRDATLR